MVEEEEDLNDFTFTALGRPDIEPMPWCKDGDDEHPDDFVNDDEKLNCSVKDIYYRGKLRWTRENRHKPWTRWQPRPSQSEDPLF